MFEEKTFGKTNVGKGLYAGQNEMMSWGYEQVGWMGNLLKAGKPPLLT